MYRDLPLSEIVASPSNPREVREKEADRELVQSIRESGVLEPILVRPKDGLFEIVFGERRYQAAQELALETIPALVRELGDEQVLEIQLAENLRRADMHPIDEAHAYERWAREWNHDHGYIATKLGVSRAKVMRRMALAKLSKTAKSAFRKNVIELGIAELLARIPDERHQDAVMKSISQLTDNNQRVTIEVVRGMILRDYTLDLTDAPFEVDDAALVPNCGACGECPKRSINQAKLWEDVDTGDRCTDSACFKAKNEANWASRKMLAEIDGEQIATSAQNRSIFGHSEMVAGGYVGLDDKARDDAKGRSWRRVLGKRLEKSQIILARSPRGHAREVVSTEDAIAIARDLGMEWAQRAEPQAPTSPEQKRREAEKAKLEDDARTMGMLAAVDRARKTGLDERFAELVACHVLATTRTDELREIYEASGVLTPGDGEGKEAKIVAAHLKKISIEARVAELVRLIAIIDGAPGAQDAIAIYDVDLAAIKRELKEAAKSAKKSE